MSIPHHRRPAASRSRLPQPPRPPRAEEKRRGVRTRGSAGTTGATGTVPGTMAAGGTIPGPTSSRPHDPRRQNPRNKKTLRPISMRMRRPIRNAHPRRSGTGVVANRPKRSLKSGPTIRTASKDAFPARRFFNFKNQRPYYSSVPDHPAEGISSLDQGLGQSFFNDRIIFVPTKK